MCVSRRETAGKSPDAGGAERYFRFSDSKPS